MPTEIRLVSETPPVDAFIRMRADLGWGEISRETAAGALARSTFAVSAYQGGILVGFGRVLGDGLYFFLEDIIVAPGTQGQGLGRRIVETLVAEIEARAAPGGMIMLMAAPGKEPFYERLGFTTRPNATQGAGMSRLIRVAPP